MDSLAAVFVSTVWFTVQLLAVLVLAAVTASAAVSGVLSLTDDLVQRRRR